MDLIWKPLLGFNYAAPLLLMTSKNAHSSDYNTCKIVYCCIRQCLKSCKTRRTHKTFPMLIGLYQWEQVLQNREQIYSALLVIVQIASEPLLPSRAFLKILIFQGEAQCKTAIVLGSTGERWENPIPSMGNRGQDQCWLLLCLKVCVICFQTALTVLSRELRIISLNSVPHFQTAVLDICLACATHIKPTGAIQAYSESEVQKD